MNLLDLSVCRTNLSFEEEDSQWLLIQKAKEEEVLKIEFKLPNDAVKELLKVCNDAYLKGSEGTSAHLWNEQRKLILHDKISTILLPSMEKEARALLNGKAKKILIIEIWDAILEQSMCCTISKQQKYCCA
jgi:transcription elongation factor SPT6